MAKVEIKSEHNKTEVCVDGVKVNGVLGMSLLATPAGVPVLRLDIHATEIMADIDNAAIEKRVGNSN